MEALRRYGEAFGLDDLIDVFLVQRAHAVAEFADEVEREARPAVKEEQKFLAAEKQGGRFGLGAGGRRARGIVEHGHFAEEVVGADGREDARFVGADDCGDLHAAGLDHVEAVARFTGSKDELSGRKVAVLSGALKSLKFLAEHAGKSLVGRRSHKVRDTTGERSQ